MLVSQLIAADVAYFAAHTNLDGAVGGLCDLVAARTRASRPAPVGARRRRLEEVRGLRAARGDRPRESGRVRGRGGAHRGVSGLRIRRLRERERSCAGAAATPHVGRPGRPERVAEARWETVVPAECLAAVINAYLEAHPYEEPAFDVYPVEDVLTRGGQGRVGSTRAATSLLSLAESAAEAFGLSEVTYAGDGERIVDRVAVVTGSGGSLMEAAAGRADVFVTGDLHYHDAERAADLGLDLIVLPHGRLEAWAMRRWTETLDAALRTWSVPARFSTRGRSPWHAVRPVVGIRPDPAGPGRQGGAPLRSGTGGRRGVVGRGGSRPFGARSRARMMSLRCSCCAPTEARGATPAPAPSA